MEHIKNLIEAIASGDLVTSKKILESVLADKVTQRIEERKQEIAESLFIEEETVEVDKEILESYLQSEEFEQLDELSKDTLKSYIKKAGPDVAAKDTEAKHHAGLYRNHWRLDSRFKADRLSAKSKSRKDSMGKAVDRLTKEEFEQLDELSGGTLGSFIQKRHEKNKEVRQHTNDLENHPKITPLQSKLSDYYGRREYTKTGDSKYRKQINALHQKIHDTKKKIDPNFPKSTIQKHRGIEKAVTRLTNNKKLTD